MDSASLLFIRQFVITLLLLVLAGLILIYANYQPHRLRFAGLVLAVGACASFNLMYLLKGLNPFARYILPGFVSILLFNSVVRGSSVENVFFSFIALFNLLLGLFWFVQLKIKAK